VEPDEGMLAAYEKAGSRLKARAAELKLKSGLPAQTRDGRRVEVAANIGTPADVAPSLAAGAEGVGLYRTEVLFLDRVSSPTEEEQYIAYVEIVKGFYPARVIIRTLDIGGDKEIPYLNLPREENPFLGVRGLRLCLEHQDLFRSQLRAICRASARGKVSVMFPMVCVPGEIQAARALVREAQESLKAEGVPFDPEMEVGIMVETPAAAVAADLLAPYCDFFSLGTNDLVQYTMAADRVNRGVAHLQRTEEPPVLRLIAGTIEAGHRAGIRVGICGEAAGDPSLTAVFVGMGIDELSMAASQVPVVKEAIRSLNMAEARAIARKAMLVADSESQVVL